MMMMVVIVMMSGVQYSTLTVQLYSNLQVRLIGFRAQYIRLEIFIVLAFILSS